MTEDTKGYFVMFRANKIQDLVHSSSRLREVAGGSYQLEEFCGNVPSELCTKLGINNRTIITSAGGVISIIFEDRTTAKDFAGHLQELYRRVIGGRLLSSMDFDQPDATGSEVKTLVDAAIRRAKRLGNPPTATIANPYVATCKSCGENLAELRETIDDVDQFYCSTCSRKNRAFESFREAFGKDLDKKRQIPESVDEIAKTDPRGYIAYMVSDGNSMGSFFRSMKDKGLDKVTWASEEMPRIIERALCSPASDAVEEAGYLQGSENDALLPIFPLIIGGDDCFVVWPAPCGFSMALDFMEQFSKQMKDEFETDVTMSVGLVLTKQTLSHKQAHQIGERLLQIAKQKSKKGNEEATIAFTVVKGSLHDYSLETQNIPVLTIEQGHKLLETRFGLRNLSGSSRHNILELIEEYGSKFKEKPEFKRILEQYADDESAGNTQSSVSDDIRNMIDHNVGPTHDIDGYVLLQQLLLCWNFLYDHKKRAAEYEG